MNSFFLAILSALTTGFMEDSPWMQPAQNDLPGFNMSCSICHTNPCDLHTDHFHLSRSMMQFSPVFAVSGKCCLQFSCGRWPSVSDQITGRGCACSQSAGETAQAFSLLFPYFKHLTKLSPCAQTEVLWLIIQTALSSCVSMSRVRLGSWAVPVP